MFGEMMIGQIQMIKKIAHRTDKWDYSGGDIGNIWVDTKGKKYHHIVSIMEAQYKDTGNRNFIVDYKKGEMFLEDEEYNNEQDIRDESNYLVRV